MRGGSAPSYEQPTEGLIERWPQSAGIVEGDDGGETTVATWTGIVEGVVLGNTPAANQPRLPASTPTFEGDGSTVVHYLKVAAQTGLEDHNSHTLAVACSINAASGARIIFESIAAAKVWRIRTDNGLFGFTAPGAGNVSSAVAADGSFRVLILTLDAATGDAVLYDGEDAIASSDAYDGLGEVSAGLAIGSGNNGAIARGISGEINEVDLYEGVLDADTRAQLVGFLTNEYT
jgi:hypothetical protein